MRWLASIVLMTSLFGASASAQDTAATEDVPDLTDEEARNLFEAGRSAYMDGRFEDALGHFQQAYALSERPVLLFNIGSCLDRLRRDEEALDHFERFLEAVPETHNRAEVEGRIRLLRENIASGAAGGDAGDSPEVDGIDEDDGGGGRLWTWVALASAGVLGAAALGTWFAGNAEEDNLRDTCAAMPPTRLEGCSDEQVSTLRTLDTLTNVFLFTALGAAALSVVLFFVEGGGDDGDARSASLRLSPMGAELSGRF